MPYTVVDKGSKYFNTVTWTGNGTTQSITGVGFQPDWVWIKKRSGGTARSHQLYDIIRTATKYLHSDSDGVEGTFSNGLTAFNSDGFSIGDSDGVNGNTFTYVAWNWLGANTTVSNTSGTISSTVSASTISGFSIVSYTGNGSSAQTVGHGLGATPKIIFIKRRNSASDWQVGNSNDFTKQLHLNDTTAYTANAGIFSAPNSTTFTIGTNSTVNGSSDTFIAYCFADVKGYSKIGSYTGNGSTDGTFVYTGFKPAFLLFKRSSGAGNNWVLLDNKRNTFNIMGEGLFPNSSDAGFAYSIIDFTSNGFKLRASDVWNNGSGETIIYMAFAENPFVSSKGIPTTAR
jgi:hypothetical protein